MIYSLERQACLQDRRLPSYSILHGAQKVKLWGAEETGGASDTTAAARFESVEA
jgi:hypothetical protein